MRARYYHGTSADKPDEVLAVLFHGGKPPAAWLSQALSAAKTSDLVHLVVWRIAEATGPEVKARVERELGSHAWTGVTSNMARGILRYSRQRATAREALREERA